MPDEIPPQTASDDQTTPGSVLYDLWLLQQALYPLIENTIRATGLSAAEFGLYLMIEELQPVTPGDIASESGMRANTVSTALQRLERRGHIVRTPNEADKRSVLISLSESGQELTVEAITLNQALLDRLSAMIDTSATAEAVEQLSRSVRVLANLPPRQPSRAAPTYGR